ncbi:hypothetical protein LUZ60_000414 [Juncus effusus]|nr:hypothetical protein LUZ60_000414 [Juncus effusus]
MDDKKERKTPLLFLTFFFISLLLNILLLFNRFLSLPPTRLGSTGLSSGWTRQAALEAEQVAALTCSGHGRAFLDGLLEDGFQKCECNTCYSGDDCSVFLSDCDADVDSGNPLFLEPYWKQHAASSAVVISGWHRMSYVTTDTFMSLELEKHIRLLHEAVGNAVTKDKYLIFGTGSTQLINAMIYALSPENSSSPASIVATPPFYPMYKSQTDMFNGREYEWEGITSNWENSTVSNFIEFVTAPNNPDGLMHEPVLGGSSVIYDHAYYWPHFSAISYSADEDVMLFSGSKSSGHASSRFGWALISDEKVFEKATLYMQMNSMGVSRDTQLRILKIIKSMLSQIGGDEDIFKFGFNTMKERWSKLNSVINSTTRFSLQLLSPKYCMYFKKIRDPSPAYAWLKCENEEETDCSEVLMKGGIISRGGSAFNYSTRYTRLSLIKTNDDFEMLLNKMKTLVTSTEEDRNIVGSI